jgi:hypothetical protein
MSKATYPLKLPLSIKKAAAAGKEDGVSLNQWIAVAVAEKVGVVETAAEFFKKRAGKATGDSRLLGLCLSTSFRLVSNLVMSAIFCKLRHSPIRQFTKGLRVQLLCRMYSGREIRH